MRAVATIFSVSFASKVKRQLRKSEKARTSNINLKLENQTQANRPPAQLPQSQPDQRNDPEGIYCEPEPEPPGRGSVDSLELHPKDRPTNIPSDESLASSATEVAMPHRVKQLTVANTTSATESSQQHSTERTMNCDNSKLESAEISALSQDQDIDSASGYASKIPQKICISPSDTPISSPVVRGEQEPPGIQNESYVKDTVCNRDKSASAVNADTANHSSYSNRPPPLTQRLQKTSDAYMIPCELLSESVDIGNLSPSESNYYLECFP